MITIEIIGLDDYNLFKSISNCSDVISENQYEATIKKSIVTDPDIEELKKYPVVKINDDIFMKGKIPGINDYKKKIAELLKEYFY